MTMQEVAEFFWDALPVGLEVEAGRESLRITVLTVELPLTGDPPEAAARLSDGTKAVEDLTDRARRRLPGQNDWSRIAPFRRSQSGEGVRAAGEANVAEYQGVPTAKGTEGV